MGFPWDDLGCSRIYTCTDVRLQTDDGTDALTSFAMNSNVRKYKAAQQSPRVRCDNMLASYRGQ